jgi:cAMP-binding proteins - catabolite gene activator and regulatory subunit of cAMP-dependent protein kinases
MDGKTARCDPSLDTIARFCGLSRRTVVRQLHTLRERKIINWVRRTVKTGNAKGEGPQRQQTSNAYFINLTALPIEMIRTLRQRLGDKLREVSKVIAGSGPVPSRMAIQAERIMKGLAAGWGATDRAEKAQRRNLAGASAGEIAAHMYGDDTSSAQEHAEMLGLSFGPSASAKLALYPGSRT